MAPEPTPTSPATAPSAQLSLAHAVRDWPLWRVLAGCIGTSLIGGTILLAIPRGVEAARSVPTTRVAEPSEAPAALVVPPAGVVSEEHSAAVPVTAAPRPPRPRQAPPAADSLTQEIALLSLATSALHQGKSTLALRFLDEHQRKFPNGQLGEERRAAKAQVLCLSGHRGEAQSELALLLVPPSPAGVRAKLLCGSDSRYPSLTGVAGAAR